MNNRFTSYQQQILRWLLIVVVIAGLAFVGIRYPEQGDFPGFPLPDEELSLRETKGD